MADPDNIFAVGDDFFLRREADDEEVIFLDRFLNLADAALSAEERSSKLGPNSSERSVPKRRRLRAYWLVGHARRFGPIGTKRRR
jgi:hypothetical protein